MAVMTQRFVHRSGRQSIRLSGSLHAERLMRAPVVVRQYPIANHASGVLRGLETMLMRAQPRLCAPERLRSSAARRGRPGGAHARRAIAAEAGGTLGIRRARGPRDHLRAGRAADPALVLEQRIYIPYAR